MDISERSSRKHQSPQRRSKGAPIVLMMLAYGARASCAQLGRDFALERQILWNVIIAGRFPEVNMRETGAPLCV